jgi:Raf kinase inhibitor-like YbhB/YbcL family protein
MTITPAKALLSTLTTALTLAAFGARAAHAADVFTLSSTAFKDGQLLPKPVGDIPARGANCKGENVSPQLSWSNAPEGTRSFVFVVSDPDAGLGAGITHWVAYGISPETTSFAEGEASQPSGKYVTGKSTKNIPGFGGPCPPQGSPHHYLFQIVATDRDPKDLPPGLTIAELQEKLKGHRKGESSLVGTYVNPYPP